MSTEIDVACAAYHADFSRQSAMGRAAVNHQEAMTAALAAVEPLIRERLAREVEAARVASGNDAAPWYIAAHIVRGDAS